MHDEAKPFENILGNKVNTEAQPIVADESMTETSQRPASRKSDVDEHNNVASSLFEQKSLPAAVNALQERNPSKQTINITEASQKELPPTGSSSMITIDPSEKKTLPVISSLEQISRGLGSAAAPQSEAGQSKHIDTEPFDTNIPKTARPPKKPKKRITKFQVPKSRPVPSVPALPLPLETEAYRTNINRLATRFSHFKNVATGTTRHSWSSRIVLLDRFEDQLSNTNELQELWKDSSSAPAYQDFYTTLRTCSEQCVQRIIFIEDLSPSLIDLLGTTFQIAPHVFEEHLDNSGYAMLESRNRSRAAAWQVGSSVQDFSSVIWYRPVLPLLPMTRRFRANLMMNRRPAVSCLSDGCNRPHQVNLQTSGNIWRHYLELCPEPGIYYKGSETEYPVGWEERATIWSRDIDGCKFVILLLDPVPTAAIYQDSRATRRTVEHRLPMLASLLPRSAEQRGPERGRISVHDWIAQSADPSIAPPHHPLNSSSPPLRPSHNISTSELPPPLPQPSPPLLPSEAIEIAPNPQKLKKSRTTGHDLKAIDDQQSPAVLRRWATKPDMELESNENMKTNVTASDNHPQNITLSGQAPSLPSPPPAPDPPAGHDPSIIEHHEPFVPYHPIKARLSSSTKVSEKFTERHIEQYTRSLQVPSSTLEEFEYLLSLPQRGKEAEPDPFRALLRVIHDDTQSLADVIRTSLRRIREGTLDEDLIQKRVTFWRSFLHRLNFNLTEVDERLRAFMHFTYDSETHSLTFDRHKELPSEKLAKSARLTLKNCLELLDKSSSSLLAEMQIVESRRSIAEAESVSKLTELAFVFIPLSFVASLFSMQVHELTGGVSLYVFVTVAIGFVVAAYALRLSIRSSRLIRYRNNVMLQIRDASQIQPNQPIPTHTFLIWVCGTAGKHIVKFVTVVAPILLVLSVIAAILSPIILLWLRKIDKGFSAVITVLLLLFDGVLVYPLISTASGQFQIDPRAILVEVRENHKRNQRKRKKAKMRQKRKMGTDLEAPDIESSEGSDNDTGSSEP